MRIYEEVDVMKGGKGGKGEKGGGGERVEGKKDGWMDRRDIIPMAILPPSTYLIPAIRPSTIHWPPRKEKLLLALNGFPNGKVRW